MVWDILHITDTNAFKKRLKTVLFDRAYWLIIVVVRHSWTVRMSGALQISHCICICKTWNWQTWTASLAYWLDLCVYMYGWWRCTYMLIVDNIGTVTCGCSCNLFVPQSRVDARKYFSPHALYNVGVLYINYLTFVFLPRDAIAWARPMPPRGVCPSVRHVHVFCGNE